MPDDLIAGLEAIRARNEEGGKIYNLILEKQFLLTLDALNDTKKKDPKADLRAEWATLNTIINSAPPELANRLIKTAFPKWWRFGRDIFGLGS